MKCSRFRSPEPGLCLALTLAVALRIGFALAALVSVGFDPVTFVPDDRRDMAIRGEPWGLLLSTWQRWDAFYYQQIAEQGYRAGEGTSAFFPLFPLLTRAIALPLLGNTVLAALVVSTLATFAAAWLLYRLARLDVGPLTAHLAVLLVVFFPSGFFLLAPYTESLFLALTVASFYLARTGRPWAAGLAGFGAGLTRPQGILLLPALGFEYLRRCRAERRRPDGDLVAATLPLFGFLCVTAYLRWIVGDVRSSLSLLSPWGYQVAPPWETIPASWHYAFSRGDVVETVNLACLLASSALALLTLWRLPLGYGLYVVPSLALLYTRSMALSPLMSVSRYVLVLFPCHLLAASLLAKQPRVAAVWLIASAQIEVVLFLRFVHWGWVA